MAHINYKDGRSVIIKKRLGDMVRKSRRTKGLSQRQAAEILEMDRRNLQKIEGGDRNISLDNFAKLVDRLEISHTEVLSLFQAKKLLEIGSNFNG
jgi:transcriptional regulator with XRE-family HTH domain